MRKSLGIYIHIPFCESKCNYCGFLSYGDKPSVEIDSYVEHLIKEIEINGDTVGKDYYVETIFIGGGTPSLLNISSIIKIMETIRSKFYVKNNAEITIETNPNSIDEIKLRAYDNCGINRLSMGVQSMDNSILKTIGRSHNQDDVNRAIGWIKKSPIKNYNLDLIFGIPGQTMENWIETLDLILKEKPNHISFYSLQIEENTVFYSKYKNEELDLIDKSLNDEMYHYAIDKLKEHGYGHYEISNCALPGYECKHNLKYWNMSEFMGMGLGASSFAMGHRCKNVVDLDSFNYLIDEGFPSLDVKEFHKETKEEAYGIYIFTGLRRIEGIDLELFEINFGKPFEEVFEDRIPYILSQVEAGNLIYTKEKFALTEQGIDVSNEIMCEFV